jgi:hypothetical protein
MIFITFDKQNIIDMTNLTVFNRYDKINISHVY